ncbi:MAG: sensor histidine kinase [Bacillota bacterium]|nr:sensor histidine kinase [Bacillota bacterium]
MSEEKDYGKGKAQQEKLEDALHQVVDTLEKGRNNIYDIAEDCHKQANSMKSRLEEAIHETTQVIQQVDECERLEKSARVRLMEVSRRFQSFSEADIKSAYNKAQEIQNELIRLREKENYLRKKRDELIMQMRNYENIAVKADDYLQSTGLALKVLEGNIDKVSDTLEDAHKKQQMGLFIVESMEAERRKIARELHDGPAQSLASMLIRLDLMNYLFQEDLDETIKEMGNVQDMGRESLDDIRRIMFDLKPNIINESGLLTTLRDFFTDYEKKYSFEVELVSFGRRKKFSIAMEVALFRLIQEAVTNARKHSGADRAIVKMETNKGHLTVVIKDDGQGFDINNIGDSKRESYGIIGMRERVELLGGKMNIISSPGSGTQVIIEVPLEGEEQGG